MVNANPVRKIRRSQSRLLLLNFGAALVLDKYGKSARSGLSSGVSSLKGNIQPQKKDLELGIGGD
jgi:hypothetical protein